jgi:hypothetical protein
MECVEWINLAEDMDLWRNFVKILKDPRVSEKKGHFLLLGPFVRREYIWKSGVAHF